MVGEDGQPSRSSLTAEHHGTNEAIEGALNSPVANGFCSMDFPHRRGVRQQRNCIGVILKGGEGLGCESIYYGARNLEDDDKIIVPVEDDMSPQELGRYYQLAQLSREDAKIEWLAWLVVLGVFATVIMQTG